MQIECATVSAAEQVLLVLLDAHVRPGQEFHMSGPCLPDPPVHFALHVDLRPHVVRQSRGIPDATIEYERTA
jgi:hypothetical protein